MLVLSGVSCLIWIVLLLFRGWFWRVQFLPSEGIAVAGKKIAVVIPARDEAEGIAQTVRALLTQDYQGELRVFLVDDHSSDGTASLARKAAEAVGGADRLTILRGAPLPEGWTGKLWAVSQGLEAARAFAPDYFLLTDADITHAPENVRQLVICAEKNKLDLTSLMVKLNCQTLAERALIPAFVYFFFMLYPQRWIVDPKARTAGAAGGCMLVRPTALERIGGIGAIRGALIDDCTLAAAIKQSGGTIRLGVTEGTISSRAYSGAGEIGHMIARTAFTQLRYSTVLLVLTLAALFVIFVAPILLVLGGDGVARLGGIAALLAMAASFQPTLRLYRQSPLWGFALPFISLFYAGATVLSAWRSWCGQGGQWKGRAQAAA